MRVNWLKKIPIPAILVGGIAAGITGKVPFAGVQINDVLSPVDAWLSTRVTSPGTTMFFSGLLLAWIIYQAVVLGLVGMRKRARLRLADLRDEGVGLRIDGMNLTTIDQVDPWIEKVKNWNNRVIQAISRIDEPDSRQYATLDFPGSARADPLNGYRSSDHRHFFVMHDVRLVRLDARMTQYSNQQA